MHMPQDPVMLLSVVNTALRDHYQTLDELCAAEGLDREDLAGKLRMIDYTYDEEQNQFI